MSIPIKTALRRCGATAEQANIDLAEVGLGGDQAPSACPLRLCVGDYLLTVDPDYEGDDTRIEAIHQIVAITEAAARAGYASAHERGYTAKNLYCQLNYFHIDLWRERWPDKWLHASEGRYHPAYVYRQAAGLFVLRAEKPKKIRRSSRKPAR
jgi:hypothetical protein